MTHIQDGYRLERVATYRDEAGCQLSLVLQTNGRSWRVHMEYTAENGDTTVSLPWWISDTDLAMRVWDERRADIERRGWIASDC